VWFKSDLNQEGGGKCYNIIYPSAIHTTGYSDRLINEVGGRSFHQRGDTKIDHTRELAHDVDEDNDLIPDDDKDSKINYNPLFKPKEVENPADLKEDSFKIEEGPWRYVGGD